MRQFLKLNRHWWGGLVLPPTHSIHVNFLAKTIARSTDGYVRKRGALLFHTVEFVHPCPEICFALAPVRLDFQRGKGFTNVKSIS
jgi:hypothetical protein